LTTASAPEPKAPLTIVQACDDREIFGEWFRDRSTWVAWFAFLKVMFAQPLDAAELDTFQKCTGRSAPSPLGYLEAALVIGRRGGKSLILALIAAFLAAFFDWSPYLTGGERGSIVIVAADRRQAAVIFKYLRRMLDIPLLTGLIERETLDTLELSNRVSIEIQTASWKTIRGRTVVAALCDELAFWSDESSANPDTEIINALKPAMATIPKAMLLKASSPYARRGALWNDYKKHFGKDSSVLVWQADTRTMNPSVPQSFIDAAFEDDPASASAEYGGLFRTDVEGFVGREAVEACISPDIFERSRVWGVRYSAFCDPSGGSSDSMTLAISHAQLSEDKKRSIAVLDAVREIRAPFSPENAVSEFTALLKAYGIRAVRGDRYAAEWVTEAFKKAGIEYRPADLSKSEIYRDFLPRLNSGEVDLLDNPRLISQLLGLERRTTRGGRDSIDHPPGGKDDLINASCGALVYQTSARHQTYVGPIAGTYGIGGIKLFHAGWENYPDRTTAPVLASRSAEYWAARGIFHEMDRAEWIRRGVFKPNEQES
jgi:hypothetical protein